MIEEKAIIVEIELKFAWVETQRQSTCGACSANKGCGTSVIEKVVGQKRTRLKVSNPANYPVGETVILGLQEDALLKGSLLMYGLPLLFMFGFAIAGAAIFFLYDWNYGESAKIVFALTGLVAGFVAITRMSKGLKSNPEYQAVILRRAEIDVRDIGMV